MRYCAALFCCMTLAAQAPDAKTPTAKPEDVASLDSIVKAVYNVISGPAGQKRDWDRMRSLFYPGARLIPIPAQERRGRAGNHPECRRLCTAFRCDAGERLLRIGDSPPDADLREHCARVEQLRVAPGSGRSSVRTRD